VRRQPSSYKIDNASLTTYLGFDALNGFLVLKEQSMFKLTKIIVFIGLFLGLLTANMAFALPKNIQLEYELKRDGKLFAKVKETFSQNGKQYNIKSVTKGIGIYALMGERVATSTGAVSKVGLKPSRFELRQGKSAKKNLITNFNWAKSLLNMQVKGETKTEKLDAGTQDLASYPYQFMYSPASQLSGQDQINITLTTGKKLSQHVYKVVARGEKLDAANKTFKTLHIANQAATGDDKKQLWLAEEQFYLPVRYMLTDEDGNSFEQTLTKIHVE
jgi:hypothetical protein